VELGEAKEASRREVHETALGNEVALTDGWPFAEGFSGILCSDGTASLLGRGILTPCSTASNDFVHLDARAIRGFDPDRVRMGLEQDAGARQGGVTGLEGFGPMHPWGVLGETPPDEIGHEYLAISYRHSRWRRPRKRL